MSNIDEQVERVGTLFCLDHDDRTLLRSILEFRAVHEEERERIADELQAHAELTCERLSAELSHVLGFPVRVSSPLVGLAESPSHPSDRFT